MNDPWISKEPENLPDFIIGGAMKSGTTTLHAILNSHPDISIAIEELGFFDHDDILNHSDFNHYNKPQEKWFFQDLRNDPKLYWDWYYNNFKNLDSKLKGEDSTSYLASSKVAERISKQNKPIKLIFILRHPTSRTISNYLHLLKSGRTNKTLEDLLMFNPRSIVQRSLYKRQLSSYYKFIPREQVKVVLFEDLITNTKKCIEELCHFLGVDANEIDKEAYKIHSNKTKIPKSIKLQLLRNKLLHNKNKFRYSKFIPEPFLENKSLGIYLRLIDKLHRKINPLVIKKFEPKKSTIQFLDNYFSKEMKGIDQLTGKEIYKKWF